MISRCCFAASLETSNSLDRMPAEISLQFECYFRMLLVLGGRRVPTAIHLARGPIKVLRLNHRDNMMATVARNYEATFAKPALEQHNGVLSELRSRIPN